MWEIIPLRPVAFQWTVDVLVNVCSWPLLSSDWPYLTRIQATLARDGFETREKFRHLAVDLSDLRATIKKYDGIDAEGSLQARAQISALLAAWEHVEMRERRMKNFRTAVSTRLPPTATCHSCANMKDVHAVSWMGNEETVMPYPMWNANVSSRALSLVLLACCSWLAAIAAAAS